MPLISLKRKWTRKPESAQLDCSNSIIKKIGRGEIFNATNSTSLKGLATGASLTLNGNTSVTVSTKGKGLIGSDSTSDFAGTTDITTNGWGKLSYFSLVYMDGSGLSGETPLYRDAGTKEGSSLSFVDFGSIYLRGLIWTHGSNNTWATTYDYLCDVSEGWHIYGMVYDGAERRVYQAKLGQTATELGSQICDGSIVVVDAGSPQLCLQGGVHTAVYGNNQPQVLNIILEGVLTKAEIDSFCKNPWQILQPRTQLLPLTVTAAGGFQPAWARNTNQIIGMNQ